MGLRPTNTDENGLFSSERSEGSRSADEMLRFAQHDRPCHWTRYRALSFPVGVLIRPESAGARVSLLPSRAAYAKVKDGWYTLPIATPRNDP